MRKTNGATYPRQKPATIAETIPTIVNAFDVKIATMPLGPIIAIAGAARIAARARHAGAVISISARLKVTFTTYTPKGSTSYAKAVLMTKWRACPVAKWHTAMIVVAVMVAAKLTILMRSIAVLTSANHA
jgi:hypothetical protein